MKLFKKLISPLLVALLLAGCSSMSSGVKVGDQEFTSTEIQKTVDEILASRSTELTQARVEVSPTDALSIQLGAVGLATSRI